MSRVNGAPSRWRRAAVLLAFLLGVAAVITVGLAEPRSAAAETPNRAGLVITFSDGSTLTRCVEFEADEISGAELLQASGATIVMSSYGGLGGGVCRIGDDGCDNPSDCFCKCKGAKCEYWAYYHLGQDGAWEYSQVGASSHRLADGDVDGWAWGPGGTRGGAMPELHTFEEICPPPEATASPEEVAPSQPAHSEGDVEQREPPPAIQEALPQQSAPEATSEAVGEAAAQESTPAPTAEAVREVLAQESAPEATSEAIREVAPQELAPEDTSEAGGSGGGRTALLAFAATAGALIVAGSVIALLRRRSHG